MTEVEQQALVLAKATQEQALDYLRRILLAPVYDVAIESALTPLTKLSSRLGNHCNRRWSAKTQRRSRRCKPNRLCASLR